jgi:hypothetical protein
LEVLEGIVGRDAYTLCPSANSDEVVLDVAISRDSDIRDRIFFAMADRRYAVVTMEIEHKSLENVFLALTGADKKKASDDEEYEDEEYEDEEYEDDEDGEDEE